MATILLKKKVLKDLIKFIKLYRIHFGEEEEKKKDKKKTTFRLRELQTNRKNV